LKYYHISFCYLFFNSWECKPSSCRLPAIISYVCQYHNMASVFVSLWTDLLILMLRTVPLLPGTCVTEQGCDYCRDLVTLNLTPNKSSHQL
jgi:hypothetical protein